MYLHTTVCYSNCCYHTHRCLYIAYVHVNSISIISVCPSVSLSAISFSIVLHQSAKEKSSAALRGESNQQTPVKKNKNKTKSKNSPSKGLTGEFMGIKCCS